VLSLIKAAGIRKSTKVRKNEKQKLKDIMTIGKGKTIRIDSQNRPRSRVLFLRFGIHFKETVKGAVGQMPFVKLPPY